MIDPEESFYIINELFTSIDGEINPWHQGRPSFFIRLQGCNLTCSYCDTEKSQQKLQAPPTSLTTIYNEYLSQGHTNKITITGGEPLLQNITPLVNFFLEKNVLISIETNGTVAISDPWISNSNLSLIIDIKMPSSGCSEEQIAWTWIQEMVQLPNSWLKFVILNENDLTVASSYISLHKLPPEKCSFSPVIGKTGAVKPTEILQWLINENLSSAVLNIQIHKLINIK